jgi:hypothetical protein
MRSESISPGFNNLDRANLMETHTRANPHSFGSLSGVAPPKRADTVGLAGAGQILTPGQKALVHLGYLRSIVSQGERVGTVLRKKYGDRVFQVCLHHRFSDPRSLSNVGKLIEKVVQESRDSPLGIDVVGTPFGSLHDPKNMAFTFGENRTFDNLAEGYIVLKPIR